MAITQDTPKVNRHHLLFSATAFEANEITKILRDFFVVDMPGYLHSQLHRELDAKHGICDSEKQIGPKDLPNQSTLEESPKAISTILWMRRSIWKIPLALWRSSLSIRRSLSCFLLRVRVLSMRTLRTDLSMRCSSIIRCSQ